MSKLDDALDRVADLQDSLENLQEAELSSSHIAVEWQMFGDLDVGLDAAGNAVKVIFRAGRWEGS